MWTSVGTFHKGRRPVHERETTLTMSGTSVRTGVFELYRDTAGLHRWRLRAGNGEIIAASEAYTTEAAAIGGIEAVKRIAPGAPIVRK